MRRLALLALVVLVIAAAGCGGDEGPSGPLDEALHYLPADAPFAVAIDTDLNGGQYRAAGKIADRFPFAGEAEDELKRMFERGGVDFDRDVKPLLGNPFVVGGVDPRAVRGNSYVAAIEAADGDKLDDLVRRTGATKKGEKEGATLYEDRTGDEFAVKDDVLVVAGSRRLLDEALSRRSDGPALTEDKFDSALDGLPDDGLVRAYVNFEALLKATPGGRKAMRVKWVAALRTLGLVAQAKDDAVLAPFRLATDPDGLSDDDLPLATGDSAPDVVRRGGEVGIGIRDVGRLLGFSVDAAVATEGPAVAFYKRQLERQLGVDFEDDITRQLSGDTSLVATPSGRFGVRAELRDPAAFRKTLAKVAPSLPQLIRTLGGGTPKLAMPTGGGDLYTLTEPDGTSVVFGVSRGVLVIARDAGDARRLAAAQPAPVPGARGSLVLSADAEKLADAILRPLGPLGLLGAVGVTGPLGDLTGSAKTSTSGITGSLKLGFD